MITDILGTLFGSGSKSFLGRSAEKENFSEIEDQLHLNVITEHHLHDTQTSPAEEENEEKDDVDLDQMRLVDLRKLADKRGINIPKHFKRKSQIIEFLQNPSMETDDVEETENEPENGSRKRKASSVASVPVSAPTTRRSQASVDSQDESKNKKRKAGSGLAMKTSSSTSPSIQRSKHSPYKLRTPKQLAKSHDRAQDSAYDYYAVDKHVTSPPHQLRTEKELIKSHKNTLDPNYVYAPQAHSASPHGKKATTTTSTRKTTRSTAGMSRDFSGDEASPKLKSRSSKKTPVSRRKRGRRSATEPEEESDDEDVSSIASSRLQDAMDPMLRMVKQHSVKSQEMDVDDSESQQENHDHNNGRHRVRAQAAEKSKTQGKKPAVKTPIAKIKKVEQEDDNNDESEDENEYDGYDGDGNDMNMDVEGEEVNGTLDGNEDEHDEDDDGENQSDLGDDDMHNIHAALAAHDGNESQPDERLTLISSSPERANVHQSHGNNTAAVEAKKPIQQDDVMDLVSSEDEAEPAPTQPAPSQQYQHTHVVVTAAQDTTTPALKAVKHLTSRLEAAAMQLEHNQESQAPISEKEYDIIRNFLEKIKPATVDSTVHRAETDHASSAANELMSSLNKKRVSIDPTSPIVVDDTGMPFSTSKRRRDDDGFPIPSARPSYDGGSWRSRESFIPDMTTASPAAGGLPSIAGNLFGRASFGAGGLVTGNGVYGRQQTPFNKSYRPSFSEEKETLPSSAGQTPRYQPPLSQPSASYPLTNNTLNGFQGARPLGSGRPSSAGSFGGSAQKQTPGYTPQFRGSSASFSLQSRDSTESSRAGDESSLSYLERRKLKRLLEASVSASVAHQILETLGHITSPDPAQRSSALMAEEAKVLKGTVTIPQFLTQSQKQQQQQQSQPQKIESSTQAKPKQVSFAPAEITKAPAEINKQADDRMEMSDKEELEDVDEIVMTKRSKPLASDSYGEFPFDEPMIVQGVEDVELPRTASKEGNGIKYTFTPPSKRKKPQQEAAVKQVFAVPVQKKPVAPATSVPETPAASAPPAEVPSIWTVKAKGKKCPHCMVMNKEDLSKCASCEQPLEGGAGSFGAPAAPIASSNNAFTPAKGFGAGMMGATPAAIAFSATPAAVQAGGGAISTGGFMFGGAPPASTNTSVAASAKEPEKQAPAPTPSSVGFSFSAPASAAQAPIALKVDNAPFTGFTVPKPSTTEDPSQVATQPAKSFEFKLRTTESDKPASSSALPSFSAAPVSFGANSFGSAKPPAEIAVASSLEGRRGHNRDEDDEADNGPSRKRRNNEFAFSSEAPLAGNNVIFSDALTTSTSAGLKDETQKPVNALPSFGGFGATDASSKPAAFSMAFPVPTSSFSSSTFGAPAAAEAAKKEEVSVPPPATTIPSISVPSNIFATSFGATTSSSSQPTSSSATTTASLTPAPFIFGASKPVAPSAPVETATALVPVPSFPAFTSTTSVGSNATLPLPVFGTSTSGGSTSGQPLAFGASAFGSAAFARIGAPKKAEETQPPAPATPAFNANVFGSQPTHTASTPTFGSSAGDGMDTGSNMASPLVMGSSGPPVASITNSAISSNPLFGSGIASSSAQATGGFPSFGSKTSLPSGMSGFSQPTLTPSQSTGGFGSLAPTVSFGNAPASTSTAPFMFGGSSAPVRTQPASSGFGGFGGTSTGGFPAAPSDMSGGGIFATAASHATQQPSGGNIFGIGGSTGNLPQNTGGNPMFGGAAALPSSGGFVSAFPSNASFQSIPGASLQSQVSAAVGLPPGALFGAGGGNGNPFGSGVGSTGFSVGTASNPNIAGRKMLKATVKKKTG